MGNENRKIRRISQRKDRRNLRDVKFLEVDRRGVEGNGWKLAQRGLIRAPFAADCELSHVTCASAAIWSWRRAECQQTTCAMMLLDRDGLLDGDVRSRMIS